MEKHNLKLNEYDPALFKATDGADPFQFAMYLPAAAIEVTRTAADTLRRQLLDIIPGHNHEIHVVDSLTICEETITVYPYMLIIRLDYLDHEARYLTMSFTQDNNNNLILH